MNNVLNQLLDTGYYVGNGYDILTKEELEEIESVVKKDLSRGLENSITKNQTSRWKYFITGKWNNDELAERMNKKIDIDEINERKKFITDNNIITDQSWYSIHIDGYLYSNIDMFIMNIKFKDFIKKLYNIPQEDDVQIGTPEITLYKKDDFILCHQDGQNKNRLCGILLYLDDANNLYEDDWGGRLFIESSKSQKNLNGNESIYSLETNVRPLRPNYVVIDFSKNNPWHAVEPCKVDFNRLAILTFATYDRLIDIK
jgi:Rps23 Pro-64 3,4-dihydroxylase Tpa1-like proline 4-hydroxylase